MAENRRENHSPDWPTNRRITEELSSREGSKVRQPSMTNHCWRRVRIWSITPAAYSALAVWRWVRPTSTCATQPTSTGSATPPRSRVPPYPNASREGRVCAHHDSRSQSYSIRATPFPGFGNRTNTSGSCPGMINRGLVASCFIRSCAARFDLASSVAVIGTCLSRFSYK